MRSIGTFLFGLILVGAAFTAAIGADNFPADDLKPGPARPVPTDTMARREMMSGLRPPFQSRKPCSRNSRTMCLAAVDPEISRSFAKPLRLLC